MTIARPILFSGSMVSAIKRECQQRGTGKTQTRRIIKPQPDWATPMPCHQVTPEGWQGPLDYSLWGHEGERDDGSARRCPYGSPGDVLWVRECHSLLEASLSGNASPVWCWADGNPPEGDYGNIRPSIHMPRWASRLTLTITDVRVERLQAISEVDAIAEGIDGPMCADLTTRSPWKDQVAPDAVHAYAALWDGINGEGAWAENPWCWVVVFRPELRNVDEVLRRAA